MSSKNATYNNRTDNTISMSKAIVAIIITIILAVIPAIFAYGGIVEKVSALEVQSNQFTNIIVGLDQRINMLEKIAAGTEVGLTEIQNDLTEIKLDLRELRKTMGD